MNEFLENYECDEQMDIEGWLWSIDYYMPLPVEESGECKGERSEKSS